MKFKDSCLSDLHRNYKTKVYPIQIKFNPSRCNGAFDKFARFHAPVYLIFFDVWRRITIISQNLRFLGQYDQRVTVNENTAIVCYSYSSIVTLHPIIRPGIRWRCHTWTTLIRIYGPTLVNDIQFQCSPVNSMINSKSK